MRLSAHVATTPAQGSCGHHRAEGPVATRSSRETGCSISAEVAKQRVEGVPGRRRGEAVEATFLREGLGGAHEAAPGASRERAADAHAPHAERGDVAFVASLMPGGYEARAEQAIVFIVSAWDANCPRHIPRRFEAEEFAAALADRDRRIEALEAEVDRLRPLVR